MSGDLRALSDRLAAGGVVSADAEARLLLAHAAGVTSDRVFLVGALDEDQRARLEAAVARRLAGDPLQHITGEAWFRHVRVEVGPGVFVPRPETELLAGWAIDRLRGSAPGRVVAEPCTGSGAISLAIADEAPGHRQYAVELSPEAHAWAARNLAGTAVDLRLGDLADAWPDLDGTVDVLVVNPPYVPTSTRVPDEVTRDPELAVFSGTDGLDAIRVVATLAARLLRPATTAPAGEVGGAVGCEHDESHAEAVRDLFAAAGLREVHTHPDLVSRPRFTTAVAG
ncbi:N5-glutamine methyltransferase family protein [Aestuariimicrobium soli]|uniref:N5-glutamine methyltransferase family protein n=1 Tax=Aestuariimicrobium soli TaxID=2035834 RepID=UPI003EBDA5F5